MVLERLVTLYLTQQQVRLLVLPVQFGNDVGIKRFISIKQDAINQRPLINGIRYYFAVTAYTYSPNPLDGT